MICIFRFLVQNVHTMDELRLTGNHLKSSRPLLTFNKAFDEQPHLALLKEMLKQVRVFGVVAIKFRLGGLDQKRSHPSW